MVTAKAKDIADAQSYSPQYIALNSDSVSVTAHYLHDRVNTLLFQKGATN